MIIVEHAYSINFIDPLDIFVGFDYTSSCCEDFGYLFLAKPFTEMTPEELKALSPEDSWYNDEYGPQLSESMSMFESEAAAQEALKNYIFDPLYCANENDGGDGGVVIFKLIGADAPVYLHLYNHHNGYYAHGFDMKIGKPGSHEDHTLLVQDKEYSTFGAEVHSGSL